MVRGHQVQRRLRQLMHKLKKCRDDFRFHYNDDESLPTLSRRIATWCFCYLSGALVKFADQYRRHLQAVNYPIIGLPLKGFSPADNALEKPGTRR